MQNDTYDTIRSDEIRQENDTIRYDARRYETIRYDTRRYDRIQYNTTQYNTIHRLSLSAGLKVDWILIRNQSRLLRIDTNFLFICLQIGIEALTIFVMLPIRLIRSLRITGSNIRKGVLLPILS